MLEQHIHEHVHRLGLENERAGRLCRIRVEMLVHAVVVHDRHVSSLPVVPDAIVDLVALAIEYVERGLVDVTVLLRLAAGTVFLEVDMQRLRDPVVGLDVVAAVGLRPVDELDLAALAYPRQRAQPRELVLSL